MGTALVTGSNRGIGLALCRELKSRGHTVIAACRSPSAGLTELGERVESGVDLTSEQACKDLAQRLAGVRIDWLVANAGVLRSDALDQLDFSTLRAQLEVNAIGTLRLVTHLLPNLGSGSKVALITSRMGSIADNGSGGHYGYRMSKAALNAAGVSLARDLSPRGIAVLLLHPGYVRTDMTAHAGSVDPQDAARQLVDRIDELTLASSGSFRHANGEALPW